MADIIEFGVRIVPTPRPSRPLDLSEADYVLVGDLLFGTSARMLLGANDNGTRFGDGLRMGMKRGALAIPGVGIAGCWHLV